MASQTCKSEAFSFVVHNVWKIENFSSIKASQLTSEKFSFEHCGQEFSWHYVLKWGTFRRLFETTGYNGSLSAVADSNNFASYTDLEIDEDHDGNQTMYINYGFNRSKSALDVVFFVNNDFITMYLKLRVTKLPIPDQPADSDLLQNYESLLTNEQLSDVTIQVGKEKFYAQRAILSVRSPVFAAMFQSGMQEAKLNLITITDFKPAVFQEVLRFIYTDKVKGLSKMAHDLLAAADKYEFNKLRKMSETYLMGNLSQKTILQTLVLADLYHAQQLKDRAVQFICDNIKTMQTTDWTTFCSNQPELVAEIFRKMAIK